MTTNPKQSPMQRRMLLAMPLVVLPFIIFLFWSLGGGKDAAAAQAKPATGLNTQLPDARLKNDSTENKLSFFQQAQRDSAKFAAQSKEDPYYHSNGNRDSAGPTLQQVTASGNLAFPVAGGSGLQPYPSSLGTPQQKEQQITEKLDALNRQLLAQQSTVTALPPVAGDTPVVQREQPGSVAGDPELKQLSGMLDQIMDIQNPARAKQRLQEQSVKNRGQVFPVSTEPGNSAVCAVMGTPKSPGTASGFYDGDSPVADTVQQNAVPATVSQTQTLVTGTTIKLRLSEDLFVNGIRMPKGSFVNGTCSVSEDRLIVQVKTLRIGSNLVPVSLSVYDMDGIEGINVPGAITRDAAKQGADQVMQNLDVYSMNPSVGAQAASAGIQAAKGLFGKKVKLVKVTVRAGYPVLLLDQNQRN